PVGRRPRAAALYAAHRAGQGELPLRPLLLGPDRHRGGDQRAVRQDHADRRRRRAEDLPARQQVPLPVHHDRGLLPLGLDPGAEGEEPAREGRLRLFRPPPWRTDRRNRRRRPSRAGSSPSTTDFSPIINKIISSGADAFLGGGHYPDGATLARQLYDQKANLKFVSILVAPDSPKFASLGPAALGVTVPSQWEPEVKFNPDFGPTP